MRRVRRRGGNKEKVFGCDLLEHLTASCQEIPYVLRSCSEFVEQYGVVDGIYRLSGVSSNTQKLRGEFESDGSPDLNKDLYLQDIHCVSSLCKAYFRELPNPLLTYQLYDKFAEAVAIQLEEDRLVKIRDVLKELPAPHYRTLEFLMRHLVRMASHSSETNMHSRNLAIVWAPNLLRSKDIEVSGFNGTAAFMEVRVQSIVVEFILTHVPQLFPEHGVSSENRKSLPSPSATPNQEEGLFKSTPSQPFANYGHISPGDGPLPMRPYHSIIEGTDKRKGSLKGRKWMSIFNIGGRLYDPRRRNKHSSKEKDRPALRPARSMDSLSSPSYPNEGSRHPSQRPPSTNISPLVIPSPQPGSETGVSGSAIGGSGYAVTYRRGTGVVSGGVGVQGSYSALDPEGSAGNDAQPHLSRSPGLTSKVGRRAAMHITGPTMVTVPLHITSSLALGVLQGGGGDRVIHFGREKDGGDRAEGKEGGERVGRKESRGMERKDGVGWVRKDDKNDGGREKDKEGVVDVEGGTAGAEEDAESAEEEQRERGDRGSKLEQETGGQGEGGEQGAKCENMEDDNNEDDEDEDDDRDAYMEMKGVEPAAGRGEHSGSDDCDILNSTEMEGDDQELSGYVQENFDFLDHMDCSMSSQAIEFSVEPPGHADDEYEVMDQPQSFYCPAQPHSPPPAPHTHLRPEAQTDTHVRAQSNSHRSLTVDPQQRHTKSLSLPGNTLSILAAEASRVDAEDVDDDDGDDDVDADDDDDEYSNEEDESMFMKSLPADFLLHDMSWPRSDADARDCSPDRRPAERRQSSEGRGSESLHAELSEFIKEPTTGHQERGEEEDEEDAEGLERERTVTKNEESRATEEDLLAPHGNSDEDAQSDKEKPLTSLCMEAPLPWTEDNNKTSGIADMKDEDEEEAVDSDGKNSAADETRFQQPIICIEADQSCDKGKDSKVDEELCGGRGGQVAQPETAEDKALQITESYEGVREEPIEVENEEGDEVQDDALCGTHCEIWGELEDVICQVIEDEERKHDEAKDRIDGIAEEGDRMDDEVTGGEEEEQIAIEKVGVVHEETNVSGEDMVKIEEGASTEREVHTELKEEPMVASSMEEKLQDPEMQHEIERKENDSLKRSELNDGNKEADKDMQERDVTEEDDSKEQEKEKHDKERDREQHQRLASVDEKQKHVEVRSEFKELNEGSDHRPGCGMGVGRKLVISKQKVYQVKAVPIVPPKPQHCKLTALSLRQQQQQRERRDAGEHRRDEEGGDEGPGRKERERQAVRGGERERRRDGEEGTARDAARNSPISMCFDEAVAIATMRRGRERENERDRDRQRDWGHEIQ